MQCLVSILSFSHILSQHRRAVSLSRLFNFKRGGMKPGGTIRPTVRLFRIERDPEPQTNDS